MFAFTDFGKHLMGSDPKYGGQPPMQQQGMYGKNTVQRVACVHHDGYPMDHGMMSEQQQLQESYRRILQSAMPNQRRTVGPFGTFYLSDTRQQDTELQSPRYNSQSIQLVCTRLFL